MKNFYPLTACLSTLLFYSVSFPLLSAEIITTSVGAPEWQVVDFHLFSAPIGTQVTGYAALFDTVASVLPPPNHVINPATGTIEPGTPHAPPYDNEIGSGVRASGFAEKTTFAAQEFSNGYAVFLAFMLVPGPESTSGSSPDYTRGPIVPNALLPLSSVASTFRNGALFSQPSEFDVQPLIGVDGFSHSPDFYVDNLDFALSPQTVAAGSYKYEIILRDAGGSGWDVTVPFIVEAPEQVPEPGGLVFLGIGLAVLIVLRQHGPRE